MIILPGDYFDNENYSINKRAVYALYNGIPINVAYIPKQGDVVIGKILAEKKKVAYIVDIFSYNVYSIMMKNIYENFEVGDIVIGVIDKEELKDVKKLEGGFLIKVPPSKVGRIIGTKGNMINLIKKLTKTEIYVGYNGAIYLKSGDIQKAIEIIYSVEKRAHLRELTEYIKQNFGEKNET